jgi:hypothetical protein
MKKNQLSKNSLKILFVEDQTEEVCIQTVRQNGLLLPFVVTQTPVICLEAVTQNGLALKYVENQTIEICSAALLQNKLAYNYINYYLTELVTGLLSSPLITAIPELLHQIYLKWNSYVFNRRSQISSVRRTCT